MKELIIIAGPNGSGKSTLAVQLNLSIQFISADTYEKTFFSHIADKVTREKRASIAVACEINNLIRQEKSFAFETVFAIGYIPKFLIKAKSLGYTIITHYIATENADINVSRVAQRVAEGGHDVPKQRILERYGKSLAILPELLKFSDKAILYDNSKNTLRSFLCKEENQIKIIGEVPKWALFVTDFEVKK